MKPILRRLPRVLWRVVLGVVAVLVIFTITYGTTGRLFRIAVLRTVFALGSDRFAFVEAEGFRFEFEELPPFDGKASGVPWSSDGIDFFFHHPGGYGPFQSSTPPSEGSGARPPAPPEVLIEARTGRRWESTEVAIRPLLSYRTAADEVRVLVAVVPAESAPPIDATAPRGGFGTAWENREEEIAREDWRPRRLAVVDFASGRLLPIDLPEALYLSAGVFPLPGTGRRFIISTGSWWTVFDGDSLQAGPRHPGLQNYLCVVPLRDADGNCTRFATLLEPPRPNLRTHWLMCFDLHGNRLWTEHIPAPGAVLSEGQNPKTLESTLLVHRPGAYHRDTMQQAVDILEFDRDGKMQPPESYHFFSLTVLASPPSRTRHPGPVPIWDGRRLRGYLLDNRQWLQIVGPDFSELGTMKALSPARLFGVPISIVPLAAADFHNDPDGGLRLNRQVLTRVHRGGLAEFRTVRLRVIPVGE